MFTYTILQVTYYNIFIIKLSFRLSSIFSKNKFTISNLGSRTRTRTTMTGSRTHGVARRRTHAPARAREYFCLSRTSPPIPHHPPPPPPTPASLYNPSTTFFTQQLLAKAWVSRLTTDAAPAPTWTQPSVTWWALGFPLIVRRSINPEKDLKITERSRMRKIQDGTRPGTGNHVFIR